MASLVSECHFRHQSQPALICEGGHQNAELQVLAVVPLDSVEPMLADG